MSGAVLGPGDIRVNKTKLLSSVIVESTGEADNEQIIVYIIMYTDLPNCFLFLLKIQLKPKFPENFL